MIPTTEARLNAERVMKIQARSLNIHQLPVSFPNTGACQPNFAA